MADDIVKRLRTVQTFTADNCEELSLITDEAADEIERLRAAGDEAERVLAATPCNCPAKCRCGRDSAIHTWGEARRG